MLRNIIEDTSVIFFLVFLMALSGKYWLSKGSFGKIIAGIAFGLIAILAMLHPLYFSSGIILDSRLIVLTVAMFFGGFMTGVISTGIAIFYRCYLGGEAATAAAYIMVFAVSMAWLAAKIADERDRVTRWSIFFGLSLAIQIVVTLTIYITFPPTVEKFNEILISQLIIMPMFAFLTFIAIDEAIRKSIREKLIKESEEKFRGISEAIPDLLLILNEDGKYIDAYTPDESLLASPRSELIGRTLHDVLPKEKADFFMIWIKSVLAENTVKETEYSLETPGGLRYFEARASAMKTTYDGKRAVALLTRDVTKYKIAPKTE